MGGEKDETSQDGQESKDDEVLLEDWGSSRAITGGAGWLPETGPGRGER